MRRRMVRAGAAPLPRPNHRNGFVLSAARKRPDAERAVRAQRLRKARRLKSGVQRVSSRKGGPNATALDRYLQDIAHRTLTRDQEVALSKRIDRATREALRAALRLGYQLPELVTLSEETSSFACEDVEALRHAARVERRMHALRTTLVAGELSPARRRAASPWPAAPHRAVSWLIRLSGLRGLGPR